MNKKEIRDTRFYAELVIITIIVLVTANLWVYVITSFLKEKYPRNLKVPLIIVILVTFLSIAMLPRLFGSSKATLIDITKKDLPPYK